jgi:hypothetical protein
MIAVYAADMFEGESPEAGPVLRLRAVVVGAGPLGARGGGDPARQCREVETPAPGSVC